MNEESVETERMTHCIPERSPFLYRTDRLSCLLHVEMEFSNT